MVGHTGDLKAAIKAVETVDKAIGNIKDTIIKYDGHMLLTADHGNCEVMINPDGSPQTAHTTNLVPMIYVAEDADQYELGDGKLADIAPTMLDLLELEAPAEMTGTPLLTKK